ncbi:MAG: hypothetical protein JO197_06265 [Acidobacteria bacterium]|nr:hypothetical protein [Acidobacteriota bacterium]MBV9070664.1 hypothetical protein [Acidobacteriota bacterium]MBV9478149.1 hypothetical protein [Acidobacteriota bacterium]
MKRTLVFLVIFAAACASGNQSNGPNVQVALQQTTSGSNIFYFPGPVNIEYVLSVMNPTAQTITLKRVDLATRGQGAYQLRTSGNINLRVPPNSTASQAIYAWGRSRGGMLMSGEPVTMQITAVFDDGTGRTFSRLALQNLAQP